MSFSHDLAVWTSLWLAAAGYLLVRHWWRGRAVGLLFAYILSFGALHWLDAALTLLPWHSVWGVRLTTDGMRESAIAMVALTAGGEIAAWALRVRRRARPTNDASPSVPFLPPAVITLYLLVGTVLYAGVSRVAATVPSASALVSAGSTLMVVGIALKCWNGWALGRRRTVWAWMAVSLAFPIVTVIVQGFLGFGFAAMLVVFVFVATFYRPRRTVIAMSVLIAYGGLSVYVTYMRDRREIRAVAWSGAALSDRASQFIQTFQDAEWFDPRDPRHLARIDERLNQDYLVGAAIAMMQTGTVPFAHGDTLRDAALGLIPRAIWTSKSIVAGSGDLVSTYTGMRFAPGTSVGVGHVLECYINFGTPGVVAGFAIIGMLLVLVDRRAFETLVAGDLNTFLLWYLPGLCLLGVGGSFVEGVSTAAASWIVALLMKHVATLMMARDAHPYGVALPAPANAPDR